MNTQFRREIKLLLQAGRTFQLAAGSAFALQC